MQRFFSSPGVYAWDQGATLNLNPINGAITYLTPQCDCLSPQGTNLIAGDNVTGHKSRQDCLDPERVEFSFTTAHRCSYLGRTMPVNSTLSGSDTCSDRIPWALPTAIELHAFSVMNKNPSGRGVNYISAI